MIFETHSLSTFIVLTTLMIALFIVMCLGVGYMVWWVINLFIPTHISLLSMFLLGFVIIFLSSLITGGGNK